MRAAADHASRTAYLRHQIQVTQVRITAANLITQSLEELRDDARRQGDEVGAAHWRRRAGRVAHARARAEREWERLWAMRVCSAETPCRQSECAACNAAATRDGALFAGGESC